MSRLALLPILALISESSSMYFARRLEEMDRQEVDELEDFVLAELNSLYRPRGKAPSVEEEGSEECLELEKIVKDEVGSDRERMAKVVDEIVKRYKRIKEKERARVEGKKERRLLKPRKREEKEISV